MFEPQWINTERLGDGQAIELYNFFLKKRRKKFPYKKQEYQNIIEDINNKGFSVMRGALNRSHIESLNEKIQKSLKNSEILKTNDDRYKTIKEPLLCCEEIIDLACSSPIYNIACEFYGCIPSLGVSKIHKSLVNTLPKTGTNFYHYDKNSLWFIKAFIYLNDVKDSGGPFTYVEGSHKDKIKKTNNSKMPEAFRFTDDEIEEYYGKENIKKITGNVGDIIFANTTGIHKGTKPVDSERTMITINFVIHPEDWMRDDRYQSVFSTSVVENKTKMPLFKYLNRIEK